MNNRKNFYKLIQGDCFKVLDTLEEDSIDLVLTDPPFFIPTDQHYQSRIKYQRKFSDLSPLRAFWTLFTSQIIRPLKKSGHFMTFCNCDSYPVFYEPMFNSFDRVKSIIWDKMDIGLGRIFRHRHELILWARNEGHKINHTGKIVADVIRAKATPSTKRVHPVQKPARLLMKLIEPVTLEGDCILDPFMGSGTTMEACQYLQRSCIGIEIDPNYCRLIKNRCFNYKPLIGKVDYKFEIFLDTNELMEPQIEVNS